MKKKHNFGFGLCLGLVTLLYAAVLELSKNVLFGWYLTAFFVFLFVNARKRVIAEGKWDRKTSLMCWACYLLLLAVNLGLTSPPYKNVPAVDVRNPAPTPVVTVAEGQLTGVYNADRSVRVYAGIPYAKAPVGQYRWREPQPAEAWEGIRACDAFAPMAMQPRNPVLLDSLTQLLGTRIFRVSLDDNYREPVSEDCLYLNVFAPAEAEEPLPVLFYIHGGSLTTGQPSYSEYRGEDLAKRGVIYVNFAYRLGVFGYYANAELAAESPNGTTGNYGLLDQIAALAWVRENIAAFGGDPENITIAGESAGSSAVNALCCSPLTEGMFTRAIGESSSILAKKPYHTFRAMEEALDTGRDILAEMGCADVAALRAVPAQRLVNTAYPNGAMTVDGYALTEEPWRTYEKGENHETALLNGFNAWEGDIFLLGYEATAENYLDLLRPILGDYAAEMAELVPYDAVARPMRFLPDAGGEAKGALNHVYGAAWFTYSHWLWSRAVAAEGRPVYEYYFTKVNPSLACFHAGELPYA
ncbi:MAG: carboxylesterase/lipase family protein, partial [bacterium]